MRWFITLLLAIPSVAMAEEWRARISKPKTVEKTGDPEVDARIAAARDAFNAQLYADYKTRRSERRVYALEERRKLNAMKPPARGWLAIRVNVDPIGPSAIQRGWVVQPPIPRRYTWGDWLNDYARRWERIVESGSR